jgi:CPA2 family monovalent cation:H+ antiporter-2
MAVLVGKGVLTVFAVRLTGWHSRTALFAAAGLANIGEFSFVLAGEGTARGLIGPEVGRVVVATALVTILAAPFLYAHAGRLYVALARTRPIRRWILASKMEHVPGSPRTFRPRALVLGGGRVGRYTSEALEAKGISHVIVDFDSAAIDRARKRGIPVLYGDATSRIVLERVHPEKAELAVVALPEATVTEMAVKTLRSLAPDLQIIARVRRGADIEKMRAAGATAVVHGEFESGVEMIRQSLWRLGFEPAAVESYIHLVRDLRYRPSPSPSARDELGR